MGFYSAFIVSDTVEVYSKREGDQVGHCWTSDGSGEFEISEVDEINLERGTRIVLHLKPEFKQYAK